MAEPLRIGVLGAGRIVAPAIVEPAGERADVRLVAIASRNPQRAADFAAAHGFERAMPDYAAVLASDDIDLVYIALPPSAHREWAIAAAQSGKAVLCEKPFALDAAEARAMVAAADAAGTVLLEGYHYRFHRLIIQALRLLREGAIGRPVGAKVHVAYPIPGRPGEPRFDPSLGGGAVMDLGCYGVHALRLLLGGEAEVLSARSRMDESGVDIETRASLRIGDVTADFGCAMDPPEPHTELTIVGTEGTLQIGGFVIAARMGTLRLIRDRVSQTFDISGPTSYAAQLDHTVQVWRDQAAPLTGGADAIATMACIDAIRRAAGLQMTG